MSKSPEAFRTISEVAEVLDTPAHVLRFWESKFSQIKPLRRGGGRRYYGPEDVEALRRIRKLLYEDGFTRFYTISSNSLASWKSNLFRFTQNDLGPNFLFGFIK